MKKNALVLCLLLSPAFGMAQSNTNDTVRNIELSAAQIRSAKMNPLSEKALSTLQRSEIQKLNNAQDLPYLLQSISSVVVNSDAGTGTGYTGIRIRGADLTRINVTMNGVPVNDAESQTTYFVDMPDMLSSTKDIEVSKGVGMSKNGVGNFGAGIAINNLDVDNNNRSFQFQSDYASFHTFRRMLKAGTGLINNRFNATLRLSAVNSDGYIQRSASDLKSMQFTAKYIINAQSHLIFNYLNGSEKTGQAWNGVPADSLSTNPTFNELGLKSDGSYYKNQTDNYGQQYYQLFYDYRINSAFSLGAVGYYTKGKGYYEEYKMAQAYADYGLPNIIHQNDTITETDLIRRLWLDNDFYGARVHATYLSKKIDAGLYLNYQEYKGRHFGQVIWAQQGAPDNYQWYHLHAEKKEANAYGMLDYRFRKHWSLFGDLQIRNVQYDLFGFRNNPTLTNNLSYLFANPKLKLIYQDDRQSASLLLGIAQKEPNRDDVEAGKQALPKAEKLLDLELNYSRVFLRQFLVHVNVFGMRYHDQLVLTGKINDVGAYTRSNVDNSYRAGIELEGMWKPLSRWVEIGGNVAISQNKILNFVEYIDDYDQGTQIMNQYKKTDIAFSPNLIASGKVICYPLQPLRMNYWKGLSVTLFSKYVGQQFLDNTSNVGRKINDYTVHDLLLHLPLNIRNQTTLTIRGGLYNVFNKKYVANGYTYSYQYAQALTTVNYYYPQAGRRWTIGLGLSF